MRIARDLGNVSLILPAGCRRLMDAPYTFTHAVKAALRFLSFEEMLPDDIPPRSIWLDPTRLREHFAELKLKHRESSRQDEIDDPVKNDLLSMYVN